MVLVYLMLFCFGCKNQANPNNGSSRAIGKENNLELTIELEGWRNGDIRHLNISGAVSIQTAIEELKKAPHLPEATAALLKAKEAHELSFSKEGMSIDISKEFIKKAKQIIAEYDSLYTKHKEALAKIQLSEDTKKLVEFVVNGYGNVRPIGSLKSKIEFQENFGKAFSDPLLR